MTSRLSLLATLLLVGAGAPRAANAPIARIALVGGMVLDGYGGEPLHKATILIEGNRIVAVGPESTMRIPPGTQIIDTRGKTMLPGLIELHAHLLLVGDGDIPRWFKWLEAHRTQYSYERVMELSARQLLAAGITSAVDLGAPLNESVRVRERIRAGKIPGPRLSISGPWLISAAAIFPPDCQLIVTTPAEAARATEDNIRGGADVIKAQGGLTFDEYKAIVEVAHRHNVKVNAHLYSEQSVRDAFTAGVDILQHVGSAGTPPYSHSLVMAIAGSNRPVVPTAAHRVWVLPATRAFPERLSDPALEDEFPPDMWAELQSSFADVDALDYFRNHEQEESNGDSSIQQWIQAGAVIGMGSDNGSPLNFHRDALWREAKVFVDHGMPAAQVISALTWVNAKILGSDRELGTLEPGKLADIAVVSGDPLFDIVALSNVDLVIKDGVAYRNGSRVARDHSR